MKYLSSAGAAGGEEAIEVVERSDGLYEVRLGEERLLVDAWDMPHGAVSLLIGASSYSVEFEELGEGRRNVLVRDRVFSIETLDDRGLRLRGARGKLQLDGPQEIAAPMPGKVVKVLAAVGQAVQAGQALLIIEAMKMENEMRSPKDGVVRELYAKEGASVEGGARLAVVA